MNGDVCDIWGVVIGWKFGFDDAPNRVIRVTEGGSRGHKVDIMVNYDGR